MTTDTNGTRITLGDAFTAMRQALVQQREAGYRLGRSISPTSTDEEYALAAEATRQADALTVAAWRALYSAVASTPENEAPVPFTLTEAAEEAIAPHRWVLTDGVGTNADAWCLDCDGPSVFCPVGAR